MKFKELGLNDNLLEAIGYMNFEEATEIQKLAIPHILNDKDIIGCAQTGTGKTAAFVLPILHKMAEEKHEGIDTLILVPTRELAIQIDQQVQGLAYFTNIESSAVYGGGSGVDWEREHKALSRGSGIIIATPGRLISHIQNGYVKLDKVKHLILDEADRMLDIGFYDDIIRIIKELPQKRQSLMFSATMAPKIRKLAREILSQPEEVNLAVSKPAEGVTQEIYLSHENQKMPLMRHLISQHPDFKTIIVFCSTKRKVEQASRTLKSKGYSVEGLSSDYEQDHREEVLLRFKARTTRIVVATDVLSRGIDIKDIDLVINFDVPNDPEDYVHRVGRTARAASKGLAITFVNEDDMYKFQRIEKFIEREFEKLTPPEELGAAPEWKVREGKKGRGFRSKKKNFRKKPSGKGKGGGGHGHGKSGHEGKPKSQNSRPGRNKRSQRPDDNQKPSQK